MNKIKTRCVIGLLVSITVTCAGGILFFNLDKLCLWLLNSSV